MIVDLLAARIESLVPRTVYRNALPTAVDARYLWVYTATPLPESMDLGDSQSLRNVTAWVNSTSANADPQVAADEAAWGAQMAAEALVGWRPAAGHWKPVPLAAQPPVKDDDLPGVTVYYAVTSWAFRYQP